MSAAPIADRPFRSAPFAVQTHGLSGGESRVEYEQTDLGRSLLVPLWAARGWAEAHVPGVLAARAARESAGGE